MKKRVGAFVALLVTSYSSICAEAPCPSPTGSHCAQNCTVDQNVRALNLANQISELTDRIKSNNMSTRAAAIEVALCDPSPTVRGMAMAAALSRFATLTPEILIDAKKEPGSLPNISIEGIRWSDDAHSFEGHLDLGGPANSVKGQVTSDQLTISFQAVKLMTSLFPENNRGVAPSTNTPLPSEAVTSCVAHLRVNETRNALEGPMTCVKLPTRFSLRLSFLG